MGFGGAISSRGDRKWLLPSGKPTIRSGASEVDVPLLHVGADEFDSQFVADVESLIALSEESLDVRLEHANEGSVIGSTGDDRIEDFADAVLHRDGGQTFRHFAFHFFGRVFFLRTVCGDRGEFAVGVRIRLSREHRFNQPLRDHVGEAAVGRGGVRVVLNRETKMSGRNIAGSLQNIFAGTNEFDNANETSAK